MLIRDVMTHNVECIDPDASLKKAADMMRSLDLGALPVCENDRLTGIITDRDITIRAVASGLDPTQAKVSDCMTEHFVCCFDYEDVMDAAKAMEDNQIRRLPVLDQNKRLVGIVSLGDIAVRVHDEQLSGEVLERVSEPAVQHV